MEIRKIDMDFSICKVKEIRNADFTGDFYFIGKTDEEVSLVCLTEKVPDDVLEREDGWKAFRIQGVLDFSLIGILAPIAKILAENNIGIFVISTYNTDYILVKKENYESAMRLLEREGYFIV